MVNAISAASGWKPGDRTPRQAAMDPRARSLILFWLGCALFLRSLVPVGWMPSADGRFAITPCPAAAAAPAMHAMHHGDAAGKTSGSHDAAQAGDCAFAPLTAGFTTFEAPAMAVVRATPPRLSATPFAASLVATGPPSPPPPARAPPLFG
jgi:hypothetical protein